MARSVYRDAEVTLLDDCLSAVDAHVGRELFDKCIIDALLNQKHKKTAKRRTVVLVTNALQYLSNSEVDRIVVLFRGRIVESGTYNELVNLEDSYFKKYLHIFKQSLNKNQEESQVSTSDNFEGTDLGSGIFQHNAAESLSTRGDHTGEVTKKAQSLMTDEMAERKLGKVDNGVYLFYLRASGGLWVVFPILLGFTISACSKILSNWWLTYWSHTASPASSSQLSFLGTYGIINIFAIFADFVRMIVVMVFGLRASRKVRIAKLLFEVCKPGFIFTHIASFTILYFNHQLYERLLDATLGAPMSFYDTTPAGRIMNRFSKGKFDTIVRIKVKVVLSSWVILICLRTNHLFSFLLDMYTVDEAVPSSFQMYIDCFFQVLSTLVVITAVTPWFSIVLLPMLLFYRKQQAYFSQCYRELKRLDSVMRSPIYALFGETLEVRKVPYTRFQSYATPLFCQRQLRKSR